MSLSNYSKDQCQYFSKLYKYRIVPYIIWGENGNTSMS